MFWEIFEYFQKKKFQKYVTSQCFENIMKTGSELIM